MTQEEVTQEPRHHKAPMEYATSELLKVCKELLETRERFGLSEAALTRKLREAINNMEAE